VSARKGAGETTVFLHHPVTGSKKLISHLFGVFSTKGEERGIENKRRFVNFRTRKEEICSYPATRP